MDLKKNLFLNERLSIFGWMIFLILVGDRFGVFCVWYKEGYLYVGNCEVELIDGMLVLVLVEDV